MLDDLIERIYEAAFQPECWKPVLRDIGATTDSVLGALFVCEENKPLQFRGTPIVDDIMKEMGDQDLGDSPRTLYTSQNPFTGFVILNDYVPADLMQLDPCRATLLSVGLDSEASSVIPMPTGEMVVYSFGKWRQDGLYRKRDIEALNTFYPHLARAGLMAARLGLERAAAMTSALQMIGLPAAVLHGSGRVLSTNPLFDGLNSLFLPVAFGRLAIASIDANRLFQKAVEKATGSEPSIRSIPIPEAEDRHACVVHIVPLRRSAHDLFPGGDLVIAVSAVKKTALVPSPAVLTGLFDLTPAEAKFAAALASGLSVREAARAVGITESSARTYLTRIFAKTGTRRQAELVSLLAASHPFE
jgi:DNA-binding CsgD family transcriptional regulator